VRCQNTLIIDNQSVSAGHILLHSMRSSWLIRLLRPWKST